MRYLKAGEEHFEPVYQFCQRMVEQRARMSFTDIGSRADLRAWFDDPAVSLYLATEDEEGLAVAALFKAERGTGAKAHSAEIACAVDAAYRRRNLATELSLFGLADQKAAGVLIARTWVYSWNAASLATIKKCGFTEAGRRVMHQYEEEHGGWIDDVLFHKIL